MEWLGGPLWTQSGGLCGPLCPIRTSVHTSYFNGIGPCGARFQLQDEAVSERTAGIAIVPLITVQIHRLLSTGLAHALWIIPIGLR